MNLSDYPEKDTIMNLMIALTESFNDSYPLEKMDISLYKIIEQYLMYALTAGVDITTSKIMRLIARDENRYITKHVLRELLKTQ